MQGVRIYELFDCKMVSSGIGMFGDGKFERFSAWFSALPRTTFSRDYLFWDDQGEGRSGFHWLYLYEEGMNVPEEFPIIDFKGGLYAVATDIDGQTDTEAMAKEVDAFLEAHGFERDPSRRELGNVITPPSASGIMGFEQMDYFTPIRAKQP